MRTPGKNLLSERGDIGNRKFQGKVITVCSGVVRETVQRKSVCLSMLLNVFLLSVQRNENQGVIFEISRRYYRR